MSRKIQAYFRTENEAEGAKTSLISYKVDGLEVWPLTDPIGKNRRFLFPISPFSDTTIAAGTGGNLGTASTPAAGAVLVTGATTAETRNEPQSHYSVNEDQVSANVADGELNDGDLSELRYVMELSVAEEDYNEVLEIVRGKGAYIEQFD